MPVLTHEEITAITNKKRKPSQLRALRFMGVEHKIRPDGSILISRSHFEKLLDGDSSNVRFYSEMEPDWSAMDAKIKETH